MIKSVMTLLLFNTMCTVPASHPMHFGICLFIQTLLITIGIRLLTNSSWLSMTVFLVMVGGLMILFLYLTSICSNKKLFMLKMNTKSIILFLPAVMYPLIKHTPNFEDSLHLTDLFNLEFTHLFTPLNIVSSSFMFLYLLIMLIIMIEILSLNKGPMRKKY